MHSRKEGIEKSGMELSASLKSIASDAGVDKFMPRQCL